MAKGMLNFVVLSPRDEGKITQRILIQNIHAPKGVISSFPINANFLASNLEGKTLPALTPLLFSRKKVLLET